MSDIRTPAEAVVVLGKAIGMPDIPWIEFTDEQATQGMQQAGLPEEIAGLYTEMGSGMRNGSIFADFKNQGSPVTGKIKLEAFAGEFSAKFSQ